MAFNKVPKYYAIGHHKIKNHQGRALLLQRVPLLWRLSFTAFQKVLGEFPDQ